ncbi:MAG: TonB-dependent siderophore receptor [Aquabacterium sp.]|nr:MAG: TonB-dependent siderophore receptor [Aquabacterium sp.]
MHTSIRHRSSPSPRPALKRLAASVWLALAALGTALPATAQSPAEGPVYQLPAQPLDQALAALARQAGVQLLADGALLRGRSGAAVAPTRDLRAALHALLRGSGLRGRIEGSALVIDAAPAPSPAGPTALPSQDVVGKALRETATGPVDGYHARRSATGTRTDTALLDTPVSVQTVSRELMDDQRTLTVKDAVANVSGVFAAHGPDGNTMDAFVVRGFQLDSYGATYQDGVKDFSRSPKETAGLERIEVLKGPAAIMYGRIEPGGMINRVTKRPQAERSTTIEQQVGSDALFRTTLDSTGALDAAGTLRYRVNAVLSDADGFKQDTLARRTYLAPQLEWEPIAGTALRLGMEYIKDKRSWALGYGTIGDPSGPVDIPIDTNLHGADEYYREESTAVKLQWTQRLAENWKLDHRTSWMQRRSTANGSLLSSADLAGDYERVYWGWEDERMIVFSTNLDVQGSLRTGDVRHTLVAGIDYFDEDENSGGWASGGTPTPGNVHAPVRGIDLYESDYTFDPYGYTNRNLGYYLQDQAALLDDRLHILLGLRRDRSRYMMFYGTGTPNSAKDAKTTWRAGVLYKVLPTASVYASYVTGFGQSQFDWSTGTAFAPQTSRQFEFGVKLEPTPDWGLTVAAFDLLKDNLTMADPSNPLRTILAGEARSRGLELDLNGKLTPNWSVIASYAYTDVRYTRSDTLQGERPTGVPWHGASLWTTYRLGDSGWKVGGGIVVRSDMLGQNEAYASADQPYPYKLDGYALLNLMASYDFRLLGCEAHAQVNVSNATDERYNPTTYGGTRRIGLGEPRSVVASLGLTF